MKTLVIGYGNLPHGFDAPGLLALTEMQYDRAPQATLFTLTAASFRPAALAAFPGFVNQVREWVLQKPG